MTGIRGRFGVVFVAGPLAAGVLGPQTAAAQTTPPPACTTSWNAATSGSWGDAARWSAGVPDGDDVACITVAGTYTVTVTGERTVGPILVGLDATGDGPSASAPTVLFAGTTAAPVDVAATSMTVALGATVRLTGPPGTASVVPRDPAFPATGRSASENDGLIDLADGATFELPLTQGPTGRIEVVIGQQAPRLRSQSNALGGTVAVTTTVPRRWPTRFNLIECIGAIWSSPCSDFDQGVVPTIEGIAGRYEAGGAMFGYVSLSAVRSSSERFVAAAMGVTRSYFLPLGPGAEGYQISLGADLDADRTTRRRITERLQTGSRGWAVAHVADLYRQILERQSAPSEAGYWVDQIVAGRLTVEKMAALLYGSAEYSAAHGGSTTTTWVAAMYQGIQGRAPDAAGQAYWAAQADASGRGLVAQRLHRSRESLQRRTVPVFGRILQRSPSAGERAYWGDRLGALGLRRLEADLVVTAEFDAYAQAEFTTR